MHVCGISAEGQGGTPDSGFYFFGGAYHDPGYGRMVLERDCEGKLMLQFRDQCLEVHHWGENQFWMEGVKADTETFKVPVTLLKEDNRYLVSIWYEPVYEPVRFIREM